MKFFNYFSDTNWLEGHLASGLKNVLQMDSNVSFEQLRERIQGLTPDQAKSIFISIADMSLPDTTDNIETLLQELNNKGVNISYFDHHKNSARNTSFSNDTNLMFYLVSPNGEIQMNSTMVSYLVQLLSLHEGNFQKTRDFLTESLPNGLSNRTEILDLLTQNLTMLEKYRVLPGFQHQLSFFENLFSNVKDKKIVQIGHIDPDGQYSFVIQQKLLRNCDNPATMRTILLEEAPMVVLTDYLDRGKAYRRDEECSELEKKCKLYMDYVNFVMQLDKQRVLDECRNARRSETETNTALFDRMEEGFDAFRNWFLGISNEGMAQTIRNAKTELKFETHEKLLKENFYLFTVTFTYKGQDNKTKKLRIRNLVSFAPIFLRYTHAESYRVLKNYKLLISELEGESVPIQSVITITNTNFGDNPVFTNKPFKGESSELDMTSMRRYLYNSEEGRSLGAVKEGMALNIDPDSPEYRTLIENYEKMVEAYAATPENQENRNNAKYEYQDALEKFLRTQLLERYVLPRSGTVNIQDRNTQEQVNAYVHTSLKPLEYVTSGMKREFASIRELIRRGDTITATGSLENIAERLGGLSSRTKEYARMKLNQLQQGHAQRKEHVEKISFG